MKKYNVYDLKVIKIGSGDNIYNLICNYDEFTDTYVEIFTNEKIKISDRTSIVPLSSYYYSLVEKWDYVSRKPLLVNKRDLLKKYIDINCCNHIQQDEDQNFKKETSVPLTVDEILEKATLEFFPGEGIWYSCCFRKPDTLDMINLPCHLRDSDWLAKMLQKNQNLSNISYRKILKFVKSSAFFNKKRHDYELEIVKFQINWMRNGGDGFISDTKYGGDFCFFTPVCDLGFRKGVVDTLSEIGINRDVIEEGLEKMLIYGEKNSWKKHLEMNMIQHFYFQLEI